MRLPVSLLCLALGSLHAAEMTFDVPLGNTATYSNPTFTEATDFIKNGLGTQVLDMPQTLLFSGNTTVNAGILLLNRATGLINNRSVGLGNILVNAGATLQLGRSSEIPDGTNVTLNGGTFAVGGLTEYLANLTLSNGAAVTGNPTSGVIVMNGAATSGIYASGGGNAGTISQQMALASDWSDPGSAPNNPRMGAGTTAINVAADTFLTISSVIINGADSNPVGSLNKTGDGRLVLTNANIYTGTTTVSAGTLLVNGSIGNSTTTVASGATLAGNGTISAAVTVNGIIAPGDLDSVGTFTANSLTLNSTLAIQWNGTTNTIDLLNITGLIDLQNTSAVSFAGLGGSLTQSAYILATYGSRTGTFASTTNLPTGYTLDYTYNGTNIALVAVPEPAVWMLLPIGLAFFVIIRARQGRRCRQSVQAS